MNRRQFLERLEALSTGAVIATGTLGASGCIGFHYVNTSLVGNQLAIRKTDFGSERFVLVDAPGVAMPLFVRRFEDGTFTAVSTRCMHRGCQVEPASYRLVCPCHGSEYSDKGEVLKGPTLRALERFPVTVEEDRILIDLGRSARTDS
jgi:cytochrome b6-f complex iron-sulfur subunit